MTRPLAGTMRTTVELATDCSDVREDVGVIVFEIVEHQGARLVVHKLAALVENAVSYSSASSRKDGCR